MYQSGLDTLAGHILTISRCDRWQAHQRLEELELHCWCAEDGTLCVEISSVLAGIQVRSVIQQLTASRQELIAWLERCWDVE
jgi:hypothetical protein